MMENIEKQGYLRLEAGGSQRAPDVNNVVNQRRGKSKIDL
jgi:hypothetical protein